MPTIDEKAWFDAIQQLGCIVCLNEELGVSPADIHHIHKNGNRRVSHLHTIPLCPLHHRSGHNTPDYVSRHPWKREFERRYGTEWDLWEQVKQRIIEADPQSLQPDTPAEQQ
jgi:hypothetical protein